MGGHSRDDLDTTPQGAMGIPASPRRDHPRPPAPHRPTPRLGHPHSGLVSGPGPTSGTPHAEHTAAIRSELVGEAATDDVEGGANGGEEATRGRTSCPLQAASRSGAGRGRDGAERPPTSPSLPPAARHNEVMAAAVAGAEGRDHAPPP